MAKKEPIIPGFPNRIEPGKPRPDNKTRRDWQKAIQEHLQFYQRINKKTAVKGLLYRYDYDGAMAKRRTEALLDSIDGIYDRYRYLVNDRERHNALGEEWLRLNLGFSSYSSLEERSYILHAASIWILDRIGSDYKKRRQMYPLLPTDKDIWEAINTPDTWDTLHHEDLIASVQYVLHYRNSKDRDIETDGADNERALTDSATAAGTHREESFDRKNFDALIALIPQEDIDLAVRHFEEAFWAWTDRFFTCVKPFVIELDEQQKTVSECADRFNAVWDDLRGKILEHDRKEAEKRRTQRRALSGKGSSPNVLMRKPNMLPDIENMMQQVSPFKNDYSSSSEMRINADPEESTIMRLAEKMNRLGDAHDAEIDVLHEISDRKHRFIMQIIRQGYIAKGECESEYGPNVAKTMTPLSISDPFELCFALLYLIDQGSDLPWLYGVGTGLMNEVTESLPWGIVEYDETEDEVVFGDAVSKKPSAMPDWYERRYRPRNGSTDFPRSMAQLVYEATGCIMPRDMHRFDSEQRILRRYGVGSKDGLILLACMTTLSHARRRTAALNLDSEFLRFLAEEDDPDADIDEEPEAPEDDEKTTELKAEIKRLRSALHDAEGSVRDARKELASVRDKAAAEHRELADLREVVFNREQSEEDGIEDIADTEDFPYAVQKDTLIFGGHSTWEKALKPMLIGSVRFIPPDLIKFDAAIIRSADVIWIQTNAISHTQYYRIIDTARLYGKPIRYFAYASAAKCARQVMEND